MVPFKMHRVGTQQNQCGMKCISFKQPIKTFLPKQNVHNILQEVAQVFKLILVFTSFSTEIIFTITYLSVLKQIQVQWVPYKNFPFPLHTFRKKVALKQEIQWMNIDTLFVYRVCSKHFIQHKKMKLVAKGRLFHCRHTVKCMRDLFWGETDVVNSMV